MTSLEVDGTPFLNPNHIHPLVLWRASFLMPGTIQVSVLEFKVLPPTSQSIVLKVALGKKEYQTSDVGDFTFPLTSLRDNLVVKLQDAEANEITHTVIQTMSIVEKVCWNDIFHLDGGGHVHLQLQFNLSDEERNRIRSMREAAMKKKQVSIPNVISGQSEIASSKSDSVMSSPQADQMVSDSPIRTVPGVVSVEDVSMQASPLSNSAILYEVSQSNYGKEQGIVLKQEIPKATYKREGAFSAPRFLGIEAHFLETHERSYSKPEIQSSLPNTHVKPVSCQEASSESEYSGSEVAAKSTSVSPEDDHVDKSEQQGPLVKTPSNVGKLVSAFESSLAQDLKSPVKLSAVKPEEKKVRKGGGYLKDSDPKDVTEAAEPISGGQKKPFVAGDLKATGKGGEKIDSGRSILNNIMSQATNRLKQSTSAAIESRRKDSSSKECAKSPVDLERPSLAESASISGRNLDHNSERAYSFSLSAERQDSGGTSYFEGRRKNGSAEINVQVASSGKSKSLEYREEELFRFEKSGMWIFPNDRKHLCITTAGKRVMNLLGSRNTEARSHQKKKSSSVSGHVDKNSAQHGNEHEKKKDHNKTHNLRKSRSESSSGDASGGLVSQAIKVAIIVGFGVLVFLTRQREPRKSNKDTNDLLFATSEYMDDQILTEEKMDLQ